MPAQSASNKATATRIFISTGIARRLTLGGFWPLLFLRFVSDLRLEPIQLVLLGTAMELTILAAEIPTGVVADIYSRKWSTIISFLMIGPAIVATAVVEPFAAIVVAQIVVGIGFTFESGAETAWITDEIGSAAETEPVLLRRARLQLVAGVVGVAAFGALGALTTLTTSLVTSGILYTAWGFYLIAVMPETAFVRSDQGGWAEFGQTLKAGARECRHIPALRILVTAVVIGGLAKEAIDRLDIQRLVDVGLPEDVNEILVVAIIVAVRSLLAAAALWAVRDRVQGQAVVRAMVALMAITTVGVAVLAQVNVLTIAALGLVLHGGSWIASEPIVAAWTNTFASSRQRATVHSFVGQAEAFGEIGGGIALGVIAQAAGVPTAMTVSAVLFALAALVLSTAHGRWDESVVIATGSESGG